MTTTERLRARIVYADGSRADVPVADKGLVAGTDPSCDIPLRPGAAARHATVRPIRDGLALVVEPDAPRVYVNARPVRRLALLRLGDSVSIGVDSLVICSADARDPGPVELPERIAVNPTRPSLVGLRVVAGPLGGARIAIDGGEDLAATSLPGVCGCLRLRPVTGLVQFAYFAGTEPVQVPVVNGVETRAGELVAGDQIAWGKHRMLLEMPSLPEPPAAPAAAPAREREAPERRAGPPTEVWWLIVTAAVLALAIAILLLVRF